MIEHISEYTYKIINSNIFVLYLDFLRFHLTMWCTRMDELQLKFKENPVGRCFSFFHLCSHCLQKISCQPKVENNSGRRGRKTFCPDFDVELYL